MTLMNRRRILRIVGVCLTAAMTSSASATLVADATNGERLARQWCASCHVVATNQGGTTGEAPPFATITARPDFSAAKIALFLLDPHPKMPDMGLTRAEAADLAAYMARLK